MNEKQERKCQAITFSINRYFGGQNLSKEGNARKKKERSGEATEKRGTKQGEWRMKRTRRKRGGDFIFSCVFPRHYITEGKGGARFSRRKEGRCRAHFTKKEGMRTMGRRMRAMAFCFPQNS